MKTEQEITKLIVGTFETELGKRLMSHLKEVIIDKPTYKPGMTLDEVAFKEGRKDIIRQFMKELT